ncbi:MAG: type II secretion system GspH family protein [Campylobacteraceae bacterium]|nr:type II secretion system GspH family protein [Campylobacteraceae bacterium]
MKKSAFTMVELIFVIVIIGILASVAIPKLSSIKDGAKKSAEIATISAVATALDSANGEWSINEGDFKWGNHQDSSFLNSLGYPNNLSKNGEVFGAVIKGKNSKFTKQATINASDYNISIFTGPASDPNNGVKIDTSAPNSDIVNKPDRNDFWIYAFYTNPNKTCIYNGKDISAGDFLLSDINGTANTNYNNITLNCN